MSDQIEISEVRRCACAAIRRTDRALTQFYKAFPGILAILWLDSRFLAQIRVYTLKGTKNMRTMHRASKVITLVVTCLGFFMVLLQQTRRSLSTSVELTDSQAVPGASTISQVASVVEVENGVLLERGEQA